MSRQNNAQRIVQGYIDGNIWGLPKDKLRLNENNEIFSQNTLIGQFVDLEYNDKYVQFLILTMQDFRSQLSWKKHKNQLAHAANAEGIKVVFVPQLDIGFGTSIHYYDYMPIVLFKSLMKVSKYSNANIKNAACLFDNRPIQITPSINAYTYNQSINGLLVSAEEILTEYSKAMEVNSKMLYSLIEPDFISLKLLIKNGIDKIAFFNCHINDYNTSDYIQLTNDIYNKTLLSADGKPVQYKKFVITNGGKTIWSK